MAKIIINLFQYGWLVSIQPLFDIQVSPEFIYDLTRTIHRSLAVFIWSLFIKLDNLRWSWHIWSLNPKSIECLITVKDRGFSNECSINSMQISCFIPLLLHAESNTFMVCTCKYKLMICLHSTKRIGVKSILFDEQFSHDVLWNLLSNDLYDVTILFFA